MDINQRWRALEARMHELKDLEGVLGLLTWDEETYVPAGARLARGHQTATLEAIRHQRLVDPALGAAFEELASASELDEAQRVCLARLSRQRTLALRVPERLVTELARARSGSLASWQEARTSGDYAVFEPHLAAILRLTRERADALGAPSGVRYDALLDEFEPEMTVGVLAPVLDALRAELVPLVGAIVESGRRPDTRFLDQRFDAAAQWQFTLRLLRDLGFDLERGRQDRSTHPFTASCNESDVRLTTRIVEDNLLTALFSTIHEAGHGLYEQGFDPAHHRTPLAAAPSMGIHESQSRLWENQVGRSRAFWRFYLPLLKESFPAVLDEVGLEAFYAAVNLVEPSLIRTEADEVTYNLHILVRFELEQALLSGDLGTAELPGAWREKMRAYLGVEPKDDVEGCLQDIHWAWGSLGYFPTYSLGNLWAAQLMAAYQRQRPGVWDEVAGGQHQPLLAWLRERIHRRGHLDSAGATVRAAAGEELAVEPLVAYLWEKYGELYGVRRSR